MKKTETNLEAKWYPTPKTKSTYHIWWTNLKWWPSYSWFSRWQPQ